MKAPGSRSMLDVILALAVAALGTSAVHAAEEAPLPANSLGYDVEVSSPTALAAAGARVESALPPVGRAGGGSPPLVVRLGVLWPQVEETSGIYRWEALDTAVDAANDAGREIILEFHGSNPLYLASGRSLASGDAEALRAWTSFLRAGASRYGDRVRLYQVGRFPDRDGTRSAAEAARDYAFVFKQSSVAIKSADPGALVALATIGAGSDAFASALFAEEIGFYADALAAFFDGSEGDREGLGRLCAILLAQDPSAKLWVTGVQLLLGTEGYGQMIRAYVAGLEREAAIVTFDDPADGQGRPFHLAAMRRAADLFTVAYAPLVESGRGVKALAATGAPLPGARTTRFFDPESRTVLMPYDGGSSARRGDFGVFVLDTVDLADPILYDIASGESSSAVAVQKDPNSGLSRLALPLAEYPIVLSYRRFTTPEYAAEGEKLAVTGERIPSAEEIVAKHQAAQAAQDALLRNVRADWEETWHFTAAASGSIDVTWKGSFYLDPNVGAEYEEKEVYFNGVRWKLSKIPEIPFVISEKTWSAPLKISLRKDYAYAYEGRDDVEGHDCFHLSFESTDPERKKVRGEVWIDSETYVRVRIRQVQGDLPEPLVSNDQTDTYDHVTGPDGYTYWVFSRADAQTIYSTLGVNLAVNKRVLLENYVINGSDFEDRRKQALASANLMLRETEKGLRYLAQDGSGGRTVKQEVAHGAAFWLAGLFYDRALDYPLPIAGFDYFDSNLFGTGAQANVFFAGILGFGSLSDPRLFGTKLDGGANVLMQAISFTDRVFREIPGGGVDEEQQEEVTTKTQELSLGLGYPFAKFYKISAEGALRYTDYGRTDDTAEGFVEPRDTYVHTGILSATFNRKGWGVSLRQTWSKRTRNEPWGQIDPNTGHLPPPGQGDFFEGAADYVQYSGSVTKEFYLPFNQKILARVTGMGSRDLDRFSKYTVGFFESRIHGFAGSGLRFTNGAIGELSYAFNVGDVVRFDASLDHAHVRDRQFDPDFRDFTGFGLGGQFIGKWGLIFRVDWGIAVASDIKDFVGQQEILFGVLKLLSQR